MDLDLIITNAKTLYCFEIIERSPHEDSTKADKESTQTK